MLKEDAAPMNAGPLPTASVAKMVNPDGLPAYAGPTGSVEGTITVTGPEAPPTSADFSKCPDAEKTYGTSFRTGPARADGSRPLVDAIVAVTGYKGYFVPEKDEAETVTIEGCAFAKRTVTLTFGQRLDVKNRAQRLWAPYLEPAGKTIMMATPGGDPVKIYPPKHGHFFLLDREHPYAIADVYAFLHPLHASTDVSGHYRIDGVPVGKLKVNTTHPRFGGEASADIDVRAGVIAKADLVLRFELADAGARTTDAGGYPGLR